MDYFRAKEKFDAIRDHEAKNEISDSMEIRVALIERMNAGELTLDQVQAELKRIKRQGKKRGKITRAQAFRRN